MVKKKIKLKDIFKGLQAQMEAKLTFNRKIIQHPTTKGDVTEFEWTEMLSTYLPKRYCAERGFVIDAKGNLSEQIDIVIFDRQYSPFILRQNGVTYIPAESVYAVIEVKQNLSHKNNLYAQKKALSVRKLKRTSASIPHAGGVYPPKIPAKILAGIVALDGIISESEQKRLSNTTPEEILNFGCSLTGKTYFTFPDLHPWDTNAKPYRMKHGVDENSLVIFFMALLSELQKVGTVPAIDINAYLK
jgi:hypothetical protein